MNDVVSAAIGALGVVLVAVITTFGVKINRRMRRVQGQVENDHETNLRDELDKRHDETRAWFRSLGRDIGGIREELRGLRGDDRLLEHRIQRLEDIERTEPRKDSP